MRTRLIRRASIAALALAIVPAAARAATIETNAVLSTVAGTPTAVSVGDNVFTIQVSATGNLANGKPGTATVTNRYFMDSDGVITPSTVATDQTTLQFTDNYNYSQCSAETPANAPGCASNPFVVNATLVVAAGSSGKTGLLTVADAGSTGLDPDPTPDKGYVKVEGSANQAPSAPGAPTLASTSSTPNNSGAFFVEWTAAVDPDSGDTVTYTLEKRDADDAAWALVGSGLTGTSYTFTNEAEGSWRYRVLATDNHGASSAWAEDSSPIVVVDQSNPYPPTASADRDPEYPVAGGTSWWKDTVTVSFKSNGDPKLADGSDGSGVTSVTGSQTYTSDPFTASGTATDAASNTSESTTLSGAVDPTAPTVSVVCPTGVLLNQTGASASWTAADAGASSGLKSPASGTIPVDTSTVGEHTLNVPAGTAADNVGHPSAATSCTYNVGYVWNGFSQPIDDTAHYVGATTSIFKAGSTVPAKFQLKDAQGNVVQAAASPVWLAPQKGSALPASAAVDESTYSLTDTPGGTYRWDAVAQQYIYNWNTSKTSGGYYWRIGVKLDDGNTYYVSIGLK